MKKFIGANKIPYLITHDARTIRFADAKIKIGDSIRYNIETNQIEEHYSQAIGNVCLVTGGNNKGRIGLIANISKKAGQVHLVTVKDAKGHTFSTRLDNVFVLGNGDKVEITLPKEKGIKSTLVEQVAHNEEQEEED